MPTVFRLNGLRVVIYPNDHRPAHVHVKGAAGEAVFILLYPDGPPAMRECLESDSKLMTLVPTAA